MNSKWSQLARHMQDNGVQTLLITDPKHIYYLTGFLSDPHERFLAAAMTLGQEPVLIVPALDEEAARAASDTMHVYTHEDTDNPYLVLSQALKGSAGTIALEKNHLSVTRFEALQEHLTFARYRDIGPWLQDMRVRKSPEEIIKIKHAVDLIEKVLREGVSKVREGVTENELVAEIEYQIRRLGADGPSFDSMVLFGEKTALPHGVPGTRALKHGDMVMFDIGVYADGYASDITRTFSFGEPVPELVRVYNTVLEANEAAIRAIKPGVSFASIDLAARRVIDDAGYGPYFMHRLGHGLGIDVHEYPSIHNQNEDHLQEGNVFTVEPGVYIPNLGGVRIEDDIRVTADGVEVLTSYPKNLTILE